jgi:hypothetical protein
MAITSVLGKIDRYKFKTLVDYWEKGIIIELFNEARLCWRALFLSREDLFAEIFLDPFPFVSTYSPSQTVAMTGYIDVWSPPDCHKLSRLGIGYPEIIRRFSEWVS